jgi:hypothetical protein
LNQTNAIISSNNPSGANPFVTALDLGQFTLQEVTANGNSTSFPLIVQGASIKNNELSQSLSIGQNSLLDNNGSYNTAIGNQSLFSNTIGTYKVMLA